MTPEKWSQNLTAFMAEWDRKREAGTDYDYLGDAPFPAFVLTSKAKSWDDCLRWMAGLKGKLVFPRTARSGLGSGHVPRQGRLAWDEDWIHAS
jgi:hypothetical protein